MNNFNILKYFLTERECTQPLTTRLQSVTEFKIRLAFQPPKWYDLYVYVFIITVWLKNTYFTIDDYEITYDDQGNPILIEMYQQGILTKTINYIWEGRQLIEVEIIDESTSQTILETTYHYNDKGYRVSKTVNNETTDYILDGDKVIRETDGTNTIYYHYDLDGSLIGLTYNNLDFIYIKNLEGDIIAITDTEGITLVKYSYDAYSNFEVVASSGYEYLAEANPR